MERVEIIKALSKANPHANHAEVCIYADALLRYKEAKDNLERQGMVIVNPSTGAPMENPYIKIQAQAAKQMTECGRIKNVSEVW